MLLGLIMLARKHGFSVTNGKETGFESPLFSPDGLACKKMEQKALEGLGIGDGASFVYRTGHLLKKL